MKWILPLLIILAIIGCEQTETNESRRDWKLIYQNDAAGKALYGEKRDLINAVRNGCPIRIGFGGRRAADTTKSVEHVADIHFLTIANGEEVFGQILPIIGQNPDLDSDTLRLTFRENLEWTIMVGTNGFSDRLTFDRVNDTIAGHRSRQMKASWYTNSCASDSGHEKTKPMF